ncbi:601_t:CDS:2, partial [Dentiscutata erythropus]
MNLVQEKITKILEDGGMNDKFKKTKLIEIFKNTTKNSKEFAKEKFEFWVENYYHMRINQVPKDKDMKRWKSIMNDVSTRNLVTEVNLECLESGISFKAMDGSRIALISMFLDSKDFDKFVCDRAVSVGVNISSLNKILARVNDNVSMLLKIDQDSLDIINI